MAGLTLSTPGEDQTTRLSSAPAGRGRLGAMVSDLFTAPWGWERVYLFDGGELRVRLYGAFGG